MLNERIRLFVDQVHILVIGAEPVDDASVFLNLDDPVGDGLGQLMIVAGEDHVVLESLQAIVQRGDALQVQMVGRLVQTRKLAPESIIRLSMHRTFSPPERTFAGLYTSSPEKSIRPRKVRR